MRYFKVALSNKACSPVGRPIGAESRETNKISMEKISIITVGKFVTSRSQYADAGGWVHAVSAQRKTIRDRGNCREEMENCCESGWRWFRIGNETEVCRSTNGNLRLHQCFLSFLYFISEFISVTLFKYVSYYFFLRHL